MSWRIHKLDIPPGLKNRKNELLELIREAFSAMGYVYNPEHYIAVNVNFDFSSSR